MTEELIAKLEALEAPNKEVFREVFLAVSPIPYGGAEHGRWLALEPEFEAKIKCQAWESAAIMLVPDGWAYLLCRTELENAAAITNASSDREYNVSDNHPAIALLICILRVKEPVEAAQTPNLNSN